jgi:hypothetical protein
VGDLLRDIPPEPLKPVWGGRLFLGKMHMFDGDPGSGKTMIALDLAARITTGCATAR